MSDELAVLATRAASALKAAGQTVATAESCTGGGIAEALTRIAGSSAWFERGWVTYSNAAKQQDLEVEPALLRVHGAVSEPVVRAMAIGAQRRAGTTWALAVSGIAGPDGGAADKPVGTVWLAWAGPEGVAAERCLFAGDREAVRRQTVARVLSGLLERMGVASR
uniref:Recombinase A n=1 Tax=uncultured bacterium UPO53 TaxID=1776978 RepID=A0A126SYF5_9BACT|nr:recombinase A [uncultured bacterium UPO53]